MSTSFLIKDSEVELLRRLAQRKLEIANHPLNKERKELWYRHDENSSGRRPMVLAEYEGAPSDMASVFKLSCESAWARGIENSLLQEIFRFEFLKDDHVVEPFFDVSWNIECSNYGVDVVQHQTGNSGKMAARSWDPPIKDIQADLHKLKKRTFFVDREKTQKTIASIESIFGDIIPVRMRGMYHWTMGLTWSAIDLIGIENLMLFMCMDPDGLHALMTFLRDDHLNFIDWLTKEKIYALNTGNDSIGSGSIGYTRRPDHPVPRDGESVEPRHLWVLSESQETVGVGPDQFAEFVFPYQKAIAEKFAGCYYGCCEPVHTRWHVINQMKNLKRVSISPWADQEFMADALQDRIVFSRKPHPNMVSLATFDEKVVRADIRNTLDIAKNCRIELILKDIHTINNEPQRLARWVDIALEEIER